MRVRLLLLLLIKIRLVSACQPGQLVYGTRANRAAELVYILREVRPDDDGYGALFELEWLAEPALCSDTKFIESCTGCRDNCFRKASDLQQVGLVRSFGYPACMRSDVVDVRSFGSNISL